MKLRVVLPSGEVSVAVEDKSTPGHLKENLKYSIKLPPKFIKLTCDGRELSDIKPFAGEPNNLVDGSVVVCQAKDGHEVEAVEAAAAAEAAARKASHPTLIKKEEPPKKRQRTDAIRPTLSSDDVIKKKTVSRGRVPWMPRFLDGKCSRRHLASFRLEAVEHKKMYPEQDDGAMVLALGDPATSPVWTAAACQMDIGEKSSFVINRKALDFDPEGLSPTDSSSTWIIELLEIVEVIDVKQDFSCLVHISDAGSVERPKELDRVEVHWRVRRWTAGGCFLIDSSRERTALLPMYGFVPIEDANAPPVMISFGEGQQEVIELSTSSAGPGGVCHVYLKTDAMKGNRPAGCVVFDVEFVSIDACHGPDSRGWQGLDSICSERDNGDEWLLSADSRRKQLETFGTIRKSTEGSKEAEEHAAGQVRRFAFNAARRYRRALGWADKENAEDQEVSLLVAVLKMALAKATALSHQRFGPSAEKGEANDDEKKALTEAQDLLSQALPVVEEQRNEDLVFECLRLALQVCIQGEDVKGGRAMLEKMQDMRPGEEELKSDSARFNRMEQAAAVKKGSNTVETLQQELRLANEGKQFPAVSAALSNILELMQSGKVKFDTIKDLKVGKDVGNSMKLGDADVAVQARKVVGEIQALAKRNSIGL
eukprot:TRINITY_DN73656_c0_g1_i1.p1 TRINITY_DN73656_c0_g1~~TRINITY_DN73656_c0_g1_i1.p1  ORF type:complete len:652 (+),score=151.49 TRINITY_DN73656_c0_g1_i1:84-2039(+)